jgi:hypothetical protein
VKRRLEDRIRELCALAVAAQEENERKLTLAELRGALREHNQRFKIKAALKLMDQIDGFQERRA